MRRYLLSACSSLADAARRQGSTGVAVDSAFTGSMVCGESRYEELKVASGGVTVNECPLRKVAFQFGAGKPVGAVRSAKVNVEGSELALEVVPGHLPLIVGLEGLSELGAVLSFQKGGRVDVSVKGVNTPGVEFCGLYGWHLGSLSAISYQDAAVGLSKGQKEKLRKTRRALVTKDFDETQKEPEKSVKIGDIQIMKAHRMGHVSASRLYKFFKSAGENISIERISKVISKCDVCAREGKHRKPGLQVPRFPRKNKEGWIDTLQLSKSNIHALIIVDRGTWDIGYKVIQNLDAETSFRGYLLGWAAQHGPHKKLFSDGTGGFSSEAFLSNCSEFGIFRAPTAGESSESHGVIERVILAVREAVTKLNQSEKPPQSVSDWEVSLAVIVNGLRNEVLRGGTSASERSQGHSSSLLSSVLNFSVSAPKSNDLAQLRRSAQRAYEEAVSSERLKQVLRERKNVAKIYQPGDLVYYQREAQSKFQTTWRGPGTVVGVSPHDGQWGVDSLRGHYLVDTGGAAGVLRVAAHHLRPATDFDESDEGTDSDSGGGGGAVSSEPVPSQKTEPSKAAPVNEKKNTEKKNTEKKKIVKTLTTEVTTSLQDPEPVTELLLEENRGKKQPDPHFEFPGSEAVACFVNFYHSGHKQPAGNPEVVLASVLNEVSVDASVDASAQPVAGSGMDAYGWSWEDLTPEQQHQSRLEAVHDYDYYGCWEEESYVRSSVPKGAAILAGRWVDKPKFYNNELKGKSRWTPKGFMDRQAQFYDLQSPVVSGTLLKVVDALQNSQPGADVSFRADISKAFFQSNKLARDDLFIEVPHEALDEEQKNSGQKYYRRLLKAVPGTNQAPVEFRKKLDEVAQNVLGMEQSCIDPCMYYSREKQGQVRGYFGTHVDDLRGRGSWKFVHEVKAGLESVLDVGDFEICVLGTSYEFTGVEYEECENGVKSTQKKYIDKKLKECPVDSKRQNEDSATEQELHDFRSALGGAIWATVKSEPPACFEVSKCAQRINDLSILDMKRLNKAIRAMKSRPTTILNRKLDLSHGVKIVGLCDGSDKANDNSQKGQVGRLVGLQGVTNENGGGAWVTVEWRSGRGRRVTHGSFGVETVAAIELLESCYRVQYAVDEYFSGKPISAREQALGKQNPVSKTTIEIHTDCGGLIDTCYSASSSTNNNPARLRDVALIKEAMSLGELSKLLHLAGEWNPVDCLTKEWALTRHTRDVLIGILESGYYEPALSPKAKRMKLK